MANLQCETLVLFLFPRLWKALLESTAKAVTSVVTVSSGKAKRGDCDTRGVRALRWFASGKRSTLFFS